MINTRDRKFILKLITLAERKKFLAVFSMVLFLLLSFWLNKSPDTGNAQVKFAPPIATEEAVNKTEGLQLVTVTRVVDGDTFYYEAGGVKGEVRMLGIDTPETVDPRKPVQCFGKEASAETKKLLEGKGTILKVDSQESGVDRYNRQLRYVYLLDGTFVNEYLVAEGYAHATPQYNFDMKESFVDLENKARIAERGLWNPKVCQ